VTRRSQIHHSVGAYGWNGGLGTTWANDPAENLTLILLTQHAFASHLGPVLLGDFATTAYQALDD
jgi:CubicO group peptidase (beta-lactamase class C family)